MHFRTSLNSHSRLLQFQHSCCQPTDETEVSMSSNNLDSSRNQSSTLLRDTKCPNCSVFAPKVSFSPPFSPLVQVPCYHCGWELWGAMWRVSFCSMPTQNVFASAWISFSDGGLPPHWKPGEREKQWRERKRGCESNPERSFLSCSSEGLGGLPKAGIESLNENWTYKTESKQTGTVWEPNADIFHRDNREIHVWERCSSYQVEIPNGDSKREV